MERVNQISHSNTENKQGRLKKFSLPLFALAFMVLPVLMYGMVTIVFYLKTNVAMPMPMWNDEAAYYALVKTWLQTGMPVGYWGFEGGHAILGTGSAWSPAILFPYAVFGTMFGWNYSSVAIANVLFLCIVNALVILLLKPDKKGILGLICLELLSCHMWLYLNTIMSEVLRYGLAILLAALLYRIWFEEAGVCLKYVITPCYILLVIQVYIFFAFAVPIYIFAIMKDSKKKWYTKALFGFLMMAIVAFSSYYLLHLISSNYNIYKTEMLLETLKQKDMFGAVKTFLWMFKVGILDLIQCFLRPVGYGLFRWFVPFLGLMSVAPIALWFWKKKLHGTDGKAALTDKDSKIWLTISYSIVLFVIMYITVYSLEAFTFYRGVGIVVLFALTLLSQTDKKRFFTVMLICYGIGLAFVPMNMRDFNTERYLSTEERAEWDELAKELEGSIYVKESKTVATENMTAKEANRWANTAALYTMEPKLICAMPAGLGVNFAMYSDEMIEEAEYLVFSLQEEEKLRSDWLEQSYKGLYEANKDMLQNDYFIQYHNQDYVIYRKDR